VTDPYFGPAYIDVDEWRDSAVRYRYVHGGFENTDTRFAIYLPEARYYDGRFIQMLEGGFGGHEGDDRISPEEIAASIGWYAQKFGAYYLESNQGHIGTNPWPKNPTIYAYRASAQSARYARELATQMYGWAPHHGYVYGGSGGGLRSWMCLEHVTDVWDGAVPFVAGDLDASEIVGPHAAAMPGVLGPKLDQVIDALEPGGGDPYEGLSDAQRKSVQDLFEISGFPRRAFWRIGRTSDVTLAAPRWNAPLADPEWVEDFWTVPGYAGADGELDDRVVDGKLVIREILNVEELERLGVDLPVGFMSGDRSNDTTVNPFRALTVGIRVTTPLPRADSTSATAHINTGNAGGAQLTSFGSFGDVVVLLGPPATKLAVGDELVLENRGYLAACHRHRYYPERLPKAFYGETEVTGGIPFTGRFHGKMIVVNAATDGTVPPFAGILYDRKVKDAYGDNADDRFRLWWVDNTGHSGRMGPPGAVPITSTRVIDYWGTICQALSDVVDWVERGVEPAADTSYRYEQGQLELPASATDRHGVQPVVVAAANGGTRAEVGVGDEVTLEARIDLPPGGGVITSVDWDFDGSGHFGNEQVIEPGHTQLRVSTTHRFDEPGTYFPCVYVVARRPETCDWPVIPEPEGVAFRRAGVPNLENLDRVRVVVS
jgi:hypothetical protein